MDFIGVYRGGGQKRNISKKEIKKMIENMKKVPIIKKQSDIYHKKEQQEADNLLNDIFNQHV